jgi:starch synthase
MSVGMPILASAVGGIPDLVDDGLNGYLCDSKSPDAIRAALQKILEDPARAARMGAAGRERALVRYRPVEVAKRHLEVYREVLAGKSKPTP